MKSFNSIAIILVIFLKTGNVLSEINLFNVNNIEVTNKSLSKNEIFANEAIKKGFQELMNRLLLNDDLKKLENLQTNEIKKLVSYYQITDEQTNLNETTKKFNISFDKDKFHNLFYEKGISYSDTVKNEFFLLPIFKKGDQLFIYSKNYFYENWNKETESKFVEFILPQENIETIEKINTNKNNLLNIKLKDVFEEYSNKNLALVFIEENKLGEKKIYLNTNIKGKKISKNLKIEKIKSNTLEQSNLKIIKSIKNEIINLAKSQNLIDIRTPSFINTKFNLDKINNLVELKRRMKKIDLIESIYVQEFNNEYVLLKIKYLGKIDKIIEQLNNEKIILRLSNDFWSLKII